MLTAPRGRIVLSRTALAPSVSLRLRAKGLRGGPDASPRRPSEQWPRFSIGRLSTSSSHNGKERVDGRKER